MVNLDEFRQKKEVEKNSYRALISCGNCFHAWEAMLPKGTPIALTNPECPNCGCTPEAVRQAFMREGLHPK